jgi:hypothetical protein
MTFMMSLRPWLPSARVTPYLFTGQLSENFCSNLLVSGYNFTWKCIATKHSVEKCCTEFVMPWKPSKRLLIQTTVPNSYQNKLNFANFPAISRLMMSVHSKLSQSHQYALLKTNVTASLHASAKYAMTLVTAWMPWRRNMDLLVPAGTSTRLDWNLIQCGFKSRLKFWKYQACENFRVDRI